MRTLPDMLLGDEVTVEPYTGIDADGPTYSAANTVWAHVQEGRKLVRSQDTGVTSEARYNVFLRLAPTTQGVAAFPVGSRLTIRGQEATAVSVDVHNHATLPVPSHIEAWCELAAFLPTTTVTILRGSPTTDSFGDLAPSTTEVATTLPAHVIEDRQTRYRPAEERGGVVETYTIRLRSTADVREGDRVEDDHTGRIYLVQSVVKQHTSVGSALGDLDLRLVCTRVAATSTPNT